MGMSVVYFFSVLLRMVLARAFFMMGWMGKEGLFKRGVFMLG